MRRLLLLVTLALALAVSVGVGSARASGPACMVKRSGVVYAFAGRKAMTDCRAFNAGLGGRRFYGHFGHLRCTYYSYREATMMGILTTNRLVGEVVCRAMKPQLRRLGFSEVSGP